MVRAAALLLALSLPAVSTLRPPPRPPSRRQQQPLLSRGALLRGALAAATARVLPAVAEEGAEAFKASAVPDSIIGEIPASGLIFKDIVKVSRFSDPKVEGVELYVSDFQLPMTERLTQGDIFSDPLSSSVTCVQTGPIKLDPSIKAENTLQGEEVVSQARSLLFKSVKVRRLYDEETNTIVYVSFANRLDKTDDPNRSRFKSDICVLKVDPPRRY